MRRSLHCVVLIALIMVPVGCDLFGARISVNINTQLTTSVPATSRSVITDRADYDWVEMTQAHFGLFSITLGSIADLVEDPTTWDEARSYGVVLESTEGLLFTPQGTNLEVQLVSPVSEVPETIDLVVLDVRGTFNPDGSVGSNNQYYIPEITSDPDYVFDYLERFFIEDSATKTPTTPRPGLNIEYVVLVDENRLSSPLVFNKDPKPISEIWTWEVMPDSDFVPAPTAEQLYGTVSYDWPAPNPVTLNPDYRDIDSLSSAERDLVERIAKQLDDIWRMALTQAQERMSGDLILVEDQYRGATLYIPFTPIPFSSRTPPNIDITWDITELAYTIPGQPATGTPWLFFLERGEYETPFDWSIDA